MGFISSIQSETKVSIVFESKNVSVVDGVEQPEAYTTVATVSGLFWTDSYRLALISDKLKTDVDGAVSIDYNSTIAALGDDSRITVNSNYYEIVHIENVGQQNIVLEIAYKRDKSN